MSGESTRGQYSPPIPTAKACSVPGQAGQLWSGGVLYLDAYVWFIFLSVMDLVLTCLVLQAGGREVNALANYVLTHWGTVGLASYKFFLVSVVLYICEALGRMAPAIGERLAVASIGITAVPVCVAFYLLLTHGPQFHY